MFKTMSQRPVGLGFANRDEFGPDDTYATRDSLNSRRAQADYIR